MKLTKTNPRHKKYYARPNILAKFGHRVASHVFPKWRVHHPLATNNFSH